MKTIEEIRRQYTTSTDWEWFEVLFNYIDRLERKVGVEGKETELTKKSKKSKRAFHIRFHHHPFMQLKKKIKKNHVIIDRDVYNEVKERMKGE